MAIMHLANASTARIPRKRLTDPTESKIGVPSSLLNWLCDSGATAHMTPRLADLVNVEQISSVNVEVADGYIVPVTARGECILKLTDKEGKDF